MCSPHHVPHGVPNEIDYGKINVETSLGTAVSTSCVYQQRSKYRHIKITKHASTGTNYAILTKRVKVQHEQKPLSNLKSMQMIGFEQTSTKYIEIFVPGE